MLQRYLPALVCLALIACRSDHKNSSEPTIHKSVGSTAQPYGTQPKSNEKAASATSTAPTSKSSSSTVSVTTTLSQRDREFAEKVVQGGMLEVDTSRLAIAKNVTGPDRAFADMMVSDHGKANREFEELLRGKGVTPALTLDRENQAKLDELRKLEGPEFAAAYRALQIKAHDQAIELFETAERDSDNKDIKAFAANTLPVLRRHRAMLDEPPASRSND